MQVWNIVPIVPYILIIILFIQNPGCDVHSAACERNTFTGERYQAGTVQCTLHSVHVPTYCGSGLLGRIWIMGRIRIMGSDPDYGVGSGIWGRIRSWLWISTQSFPISKKSFKIMFHTGKIIKI